MIKKITTTSAEQTEKLGAVIGKSLRGGEVIELTSDLGGGKTTFTRGLVAGAGSTDAVSSPTFAISNTYKAKQLEIHHFDFYRLPDAGLMEYELDDVIGQPDHVVVVEWSDVVAHVLPEDIVTIHLQMTADDSRDMTIHYSEAMAYLVEAV